jgi:hypothetical protein
MSVATAQPDFRRLARKSVEVSRGFGPAAGQCDTVSLVETGKRYRLTFATLIDELATLYAQNYDSICTQLFALLTSETPADRLAAEVNFWHFCICFFFLQLIDLLGMEHMDLLENIIQFRSDLVAEYRRLQTATNATCKFRLNGKHACVCLCAVEDVRRISAASAKSKQQSKGMARVGGVRVQTELERDVQRQLRKMDRKNVTTGGSTFQTASGTHDLMPATLADYVDQTISIEEERKL